MPGQKNQLDKIIQEMRSEGKQEEQLSMVEYLTEKEEVWGNVFAGVRSESVPKISEPKGEPHAQGTLSRADCKRMEEIDKKFFEKNMEKDRER